MTTDNLLVELFVEELPPKALAALGSAFAHTLAEGLRSAGLLAAGAAVTPYASPRRLAAHLERVAARGADRPLAQKLMPVAVGLDDSGAPSAALLKKLAALGLPADAAAHLRHEGEGRAATLYVDTVVPGAELADTLGRVLHEALAKLPIPKVMSYQLADGWSTVRFVRPAHGLVALHGARVLPLQALGLAAGRETHGHRFEAAADPIVLRDADSYAQQLRDEGAVIASFGERRDAIAQQLQRAAAEAGLRPIDDAALLDEVCALVERPNVLSCRFEPEFLAVPQECLILTMKANQKYFPLLDAEGRLSHRFLVVSNIAPADPSAVIDGNERVVRPRLADAKFFFEQDRKRTLASRVEGLERVVYHARLGSQGARMRRVRAIALELAALAGLDAGAVEQAATLAKADLLTEMVGEFPELQGVMGRYYALHDGLPGAVAQAIEDHYKPRYAGDALPADAIGLCLALSDKLETLCGLFGIGQLPTGDKDPYALRRHALGVVRMLSERAELAAHWPLPRLLEIAARAFAGVDGWADPGETLLGFVFERLANALREQGYGAQEVDAVLVLRPPLLAEVPRRLDAVRAFAALPEAAALAAANKRVGNILRKSEAVAGVALQRELLCEAAEQALLDTLGAVAPQAQGAFARGDYTAALKALAALKTPVDAFFDQVMVNAEDPALRANRLALLGELHQAMNRVADISCLAG